MIDYKESIIEVTKEHGYILPETEIEDINNALNDLITDYIVNDDMSEDEADDIISDDFWSYVRDMIEK